jgi:UDP-N-acetylmuramyl pentapeptide synthase
MFKKLKNKLYFFIARYFRFFASIRLRRWHPRIIAVTGSNGKTTLLHLLESQIGDKAKYSHHANSSYGIPFDILDLKRKTLLKQEWISLFLKAPLQAMKKAPRQSIYIVEADCDRPGEGKFLAEFLKPEVVLWVSVSRTHSMNFDKLVLSGHLEAKPKDLKILRPAQNDINKKFSTVDEAIAYEFGYFLEHCQKFAIINGDLPLELAQIVRTKAKILSVTESNYLQDYRVDQKGTTFQIDKHTFRFSSLLPKKVFCSVVMCKELVDYLHLPFDNSFSRFVMPPGRGSLFQGIKNIIIVDSCYNANVSSMTAILHMFQTMQQKKKWIVIGDMLELGRGEKEAHEKLAELIAELPVDRIILMGSRVSQYTFPKLMALREAKRDASFLTHRNDIIIEKFLGPRETLDYLLANLQGGETILFKGARFMEGIIEHLLKNKEDITKLARREKIWEKRRKEWGL